MTILDPLGPTDFPVFAAGNYVYRRTSSSPFVGPVSGQLAEDLAARLNRDHYAQAGIQVPPPALGRPFTPGDLGNG